MTLAHPFTYPYYLGPGLPDDVPGVWDAALNGHRYMIDWRYAGDKGGFIRSSVKLLKPQQDTTLQLGEQSLNPEDLVRRSVESWHHGAGQTFHDRNDSDVSRFRSSLGVDVWTENKLSLLASTASKRTSANTNLHMAVAGSRLYLTDGNELRYTTDVTVASPTWTNVTGMPAADPTSVASDGHFVYTAHTASGIYLTNKTIGVTASWITGNVTLVRYVKGRLMVAYQNLLYNVTTSTGTAGPTALPAALLTHPNSNFVWVDIAEGPGHIYAAGYSGDKSLLFKTAVKADGTALDVPSVAGELPDGEIVRSIQGYLGFLVVGTDLGVRFASIDANGNLVIGALVLTDAAVECFEPQDRFVWFGWTNYDTVHTGLGRLDLSVFTQPNTPAYASDLMAESVQGAVQSVVTFQERRVFTVSGIGVWAEETVRVASGQIDSGLLTYDLPDPKVAINLLLTYDVLVGTIAVYLAADGGTFALLGAAAADASTSLLIGAGEMQGDVLELRHVLARKDATDTAGPVLRRATFEVNPAPGRGEIINLPILFFDQVELRNGTQAAVDLDAEFVALLDMEQSGRPLTYVDATGAWTVFLDDHEFRMENAPAGGTFYQGTFFARLRRPRTRS